MVGDEYDGGTTWGVRWGERGVEKRCREYGDEEQTRGMFDHLMRRHEELQLPDPKPELIRARITWEVIEPADR